MTIETHFCPVSGEIRLYTKGGTFAERAPYDFIVNLVFSDSKTAVLRGASSGTELNRKMILAIFSEAYKQGARVLMIKRRVGRKLPWGELVGTDGIEDEYRVYLEVLNDRGLLS